MSGLAETVGILEATGDELLRIGSIGTVEQTRTFTLLLNAAANTVPACTGVDRTSHERDCRKPNAQLANQGVS
ncbi:hypothetical protein [Streptomyces sp. NPDC097610]|uniref:hypothetical protein n=1 Tax=Streptomyces sp. NPDC097610 TaxID=3157227 RepID=UPI00332D4C1E